MSTTSKNPFTSFVNAYCGLVADQVSDLSTQFDKAVSKSNALFNELASRGEAVEADLKNAMPRSDKMNKTIKNWFDALSFGGAQRDKQLEQLSGKVDKLIDQVALLAEQRAKETAATKKTTARKTAATKAAAPKAAAKATTTVAKPAAKKPAATKKPAAAKKPSATSAPAANKPAAAKKTCCG